MSENNSNGKKTKRPWRVYLLLFIILAGIAAATVYWYRIYSSYVSTDDAYVDADRITIGSKVMERIVNLYADEGDTVTTGELLVVLDSAELTARLNQAYATKAQMTANIAQAEARYRLDSKNITVQEINLNSAKSDFDRASKQHEGGVITDEQFEHVQKNYETARVRYEAAKLELNVSHAQVVSSRAAEDNTEAQIRLIRTQLENTRIYSPVDGIVARKWLLTGDIASPGQPVLTITDNHRKWVVAFIEETKLADIHLNQAAEFTVDAFPGRVFHGKVYYIGSNTAGQFSLIPPNNASGNFTKVTQRVPLKISCDSVEGADPGDIKLVSGMSVILKILK